MCKKSSFFLHTRCYTRTMHFYNELRLRYRPNYVNYLHQTLLYPLKRGGKKNKLHKQIQKMQVLNFNGH